MRIILVSVFFIFAVYDLLYLMKLNRTKESSAINVTISILPPLRESNISAAPFFNPSHWLLTQADRAEAEANKKKQKKDETKKTKLYDKNTTIELVTSKGTKKLCRGKKCITIKGIIGNKLLLEEDNGTILIMKPSDKIFGNIKLLKLDNVQLIFLNENTKKEYTLKFFTYRQNKEHNKMDRKKQSKQNKG